MSNIYILIPDGTGLTSLKIRKSRDLSKVYYLTYDTEINRFLHNDIHNNLLSLQYKIQQYYDDRLCFKTSHIIAGIIEGTKKLENKYPEKEKFVYYLPEDKELLLDIFNINFEFKKKKSNFNEVNIIYT